MNHDQILENRRKWIDFLKLPDTKKGVQALDIGDGHRCCLGHACHVLIPDALEDALYCGMYEYEGKDDYPPQSVVDALGLWDETGAGSGSSVLSNGEKSLSLWNDNSDVTPQEIGNYLETVIMGGDDTPFLPIATTKG